MKNDQLAVLKDSPTPEQVAEKHGVPIHTIQLALSKGGQEEMEHTSDAETAKAIALQHLMEDPEYYDKERPVENSYDSPEAREAAGADAYGSPK